MTSPARTPARHGLLPLVSLLVVTRDAHEALAQAIATVRAGRYSEFEIIVQPDDGRDYASHVPDDPRIRLMRPRFGLGDAGARNLCLDEARGELVGVLDPQDRVAPDYLERLVASHFTHGGGAFATTRYIARDADGVRLLRTLSPPPRIDVEWLAGCFGLPHGLHRASHVGPFRDGVAHELIWHIEAVAAAGTAATVADTVYYARVGEDVSRSNIARLDEAYRRTIASSQGVRGKARETVLRMLEARRALAERYLTAATRYRSFREFMLTLQAADLPPLSGQRRLPRATLGVPNPPAGLP